MQKEKKVVPLDQREMLHRWIDILNADSLPDVEWIIKQYAARDLNRRYAEERAQQTTTTPAH